MDNMDNNEEIIPEINPAEPPPTEPEKPEPDIHEINAPESVIPEPEMVKADAKAGVRKKRLARISSNLLIATGVVLIAFFLWINYAGQIFQVIYGIYYDNFAGEESPDSENFLSYEELPGFLTAGTELLPGRNDAVTVDTPDSSGGDEITDPEEESKLEEQYPDIAYSERSKYKDKDMVLSVARLGIKSPVMDGTSLAKLKKGPCLYEISSLPTKEAGRVLIAAHRDTYGSWFYNIDKLREGDLMKLYFGDYVFVYEYVETKIIEKDDWRSLEGRDYSSLVLTSCHPKGTSKKRIIAVGKLIAIQER